MARLSLLALPVAVALSGCGLLPTADGSDAPDAGSSTEAVRLLAGHFRPEFTTASGGLVYRDRDAHELRLLPPTGDTPLTVLALADDAQTLRLTQANDVLFFQDPFDATQKEGTLQAISVTGTKVTLSTRAPELASRRATASHDGGWLLYFERAVSGTEGAYLMAQPGAGGEARRLGDTVWSEGCGVRLVPVKSPSTRILAWGCPLGSSKRMLRSYDAANGLAEAVLVAEATNTGLPPTVTADLAQVFVPDATGVAVRVPVAGGEEVTASGEKLSAVFPNADGTALVGRTTAGALVTWDAAGGTRTVLPDGGVDALMAVDATRTHALVSTKVEAKKITGTETNWYARTVVLVDLATGATEELVSTTTGNPWSFTADGKYVTWLEDLTELGTGRAYVRAVAGGEKRLIGASVANIEELSTGTLALDADYAGGPNYSGDARMSVTVVAPPYDAAPAVLATAAVAGKLSHLRGGLGWVLDDGAPSDGLYLRPLP